MQAAAYSVSARVQASAAPPIPKAAQWATRYRPQSPSDPADALINLSQGVPGAPPPREMLDRLADATRDPATTGYGPLAGDASLRVAVADHVNSSYAVNPDTHEERRIAAENVAITAGCNLAFYASMLALAEPGDEIILPSPWYFNAHMTVEQLGLSLVPLPCAAPSFLPSVRACAALITPKTKAIVLITPNNPTGAIYPPELLREFARLAQEHRVALVLDETYRDFVPAGPPHDLFAETDWPLYLIHLFSFSKSYAIPGHRLGGVIASPTFLAQVSKLLDCIQICPARPAQRAVEWAIQALAEWRAETRTELQRRQRVFRELLDDVQGWQVATGGAYFAYVKHPYKGASSELVSQRLAEQVGIITLPGTFFSPPFADIDEDRYIRFSIANVDETTLRRVPARLEKLNQLWETL
ncbi:hypothetical protein JCM3774_000405 [Rhodotorula dairenensis]